MRPRPHLLMTADAVGGVWTYALDLGRGLTQAGVRVTLAVPGPAPDADQQAQAQAAGLALEPLGGALDWTAAHEGEVAASAAGLSRLSEQLGADLVHLNTPALGAFGPFRAPVLAACHSCVKTWWQAVKGGQPLPGDFAWRAALVERGYRNATALMAPSQAFAEVTRAAYAFSERPYVVLNGRALPSRGEAIAFEGEGWCFTAGRLWDEAKDILTLDRAIGRSGLAAAAAGPLAGPNGQTISLQHLHALGRVSASDMAAHLARRPVFVSTSLYEPFGLAVLEAAQAGCALVLSDIATFRELWDGAAIFFPPGDDAALAAALGDLADAPARRTHLGHAAQARAARYTVQAMTEATLRLYASLSPAFAARAAA